VSKLANLNFKKKLLMGAGPSEVHDNVLKALSTPPIGHLDPYFNQIMESCKSLLRYVFQTQNKMTFPVSGTGSAAMELCFTNLIQPNDAVLICDNGVFGSRMNAMASKLEAQVHLLKQPWGQAIDIDALKDRLQSHPEIKFVCAVHGETSTGVLSDIKKIAEISKQFGCYTIVDAVTSLVGVPFYMDQWGIDAVYSASQKCLSCIPGISMVSLSNSLTKVIQNRKQAIKSWYFDMNLISQYWFLSDNDTRTYHHTAPVNNIFALYQSLLNVYELTLEQSWQKHLDASRYLKNQLNELGIVSVVPEAIALPQLNVFNVPANVDDADFRRRLISEFHVEISAGLGDYLGKVWRIGLMGDSSNKSSINTLINSFKSILH
jgi:alanine-glyoxylate transaminase / serine-glyoxylate transaminase / serine-pyruvate transaminase